VRPLLLPQTHRGKSRLARGAGNRAVASSATKIVFVHGPLYCDRANPRRFLCQCLCCRDSWRCGRHAAHRDLPRPCAGPRCSMCQACAAHDSQRSPLVPARPHVHHDRDRGDADEHAVGCNTTSSAIVSYVAGRRGPRDHTHRFGRRYGSPTTIPMRVEASSGRR